MSDNILYLKNNMWIVRTQAGFRKACKTFNDDPIVKLEVDDPPSSYPCLISLSLGYRGYHYIQCNWIHLNDLNKAISKSENDLINESKESDNCGSDSQLNEIFKRVINTNIDDFKINICEQEESNSLSHKLELIPTYLEFKINQDNNTFLVIDYDWLFEYIRLFAESPITKFKTIVKEVEKFNIAYIRGSIENYIEKNVLNRESNIITVTELNAYIKDKELEYISKGLVSYRKMLLHVMEIEPLPESIVKSSFMYN